MSLLKEISLNNNKWIFEFNKFAKQANGSVMVSCGGTQVLVTACASLEAKENQDFFPLTVEYTEKLYSCGRIPGGYNKREGRPTLHQVLTSRVIDRQLRPCFPDGFFNETVIQCTVMSYDGKNSPVSLAMVGASTALMISDIPFNGPVAGLCITSNSKPQDNQDSKDFNTLYTFNQAIFSELYDLEMVVAAKPDALLMVEASANFYSEQQIIDAISFAHQSMKPIFEMQLQVQQEIGKDKLVFDPPVIDEKITELVNELGTSIIKDAFATQQKQLRVTKLKKAQKQITQLVIDKLSLSDYDDTSDKSNSFQDTLKAKEDYLTKAPTFINQAINNLKYDLMRKMITIDKSRIDNRSFTDIRPITCEVGVLKNVHGSSMFTRGETQAIGVLTLGAPIDRSRVETLDSRDHDDYFMLHYNFPGFCVGEASSPRSTTRREYGHGALAKKAFLHTLPDLKDFGYVVRMVSEVLESNGSSSMATVCASSMAMLAGGVPLKKQIAGIAMGLIKSDNDFAILTDILGDEDHLGDMDFKVCGSDDGITALQMDIKVDGINDQILAQALSQAKTARLKILDQMNHAIDSVKPVSSLAPQIFKLKVPENKVRDVIGAGGKTIKKIVAETGVSIDIEDNGVISIVSPDSSSAEATKAMIRHITADPQAGEIYLGKVTKVVDFGCFVEIKPGLEGLVHISQIENRRIEQVSDYVKENEEILVKIIDIDRQGRIKLSRKDAIGQKPTFDLAGK